MPSANLVLGSFATFNWDISSETALSTTTALSNAHLSDQHYNICIRRARGYCSICFSPHVVTTTAAEATSYGVSAANPGTDGSEESIVETRCSGITSIHGTGIADNAANLGKMDEYQKIINPLIYLSERTSSFKPNIHPESCRTRRLY